MRCASFCSDSADGWIGFWIWARCTLGSGPPSLRPSSLKMKYVLPSLMGSVTPPTGSRTVVDASGPVRAIESAFGIAIDDWHDRDENRDFYGNDAQPSLPSSIAPAIVGVLGLNNHYRLQRIGAAYPSRLSPRAAPGGGPNGGYTPAELKAAYDVNPKILPNAKGAGQSLGLFELDDFAQSNVAVYDAKGET